MCTLNPKPSTLSLSNLGSLSIVGLSLRLWGFGAAGLCGLGGVEISVSVIVERWNFPGEAEPLVMLQANLKD